MLYRVVAPPVVSAFVLEDVSAVKTHSLHRRLQQEDERWAAAGFPVWYRPWTGVAPAGAPGG